MNDNQTMIHHVQPRHFYSRDGTCTTSSFCRKPPSLVSFHICYLLNHASVHDISALVIFIAESSVYQISSSTMEILIHCILYVEMTTHDTLYIMPIHGHCTLMYPRLLYLFAVICRALSLYCTDWMVGSSTGLFITPLLGWTYNVFRPSYDPSDLTH